jgi:hypothetical protein
MFSQNAIIEIEAEKTLSIKQIFKLINKKTDYKFIYRSDLLKNAPKLTLSKGEISVEKLLKDFLYPLKLTFEFTKNKTVIVKKMINVLAEKEIVVNQVKDKKITKIN